MGSRKINSTTLAVLKALGTQHSLFSEMSVQLESLCSEFDIEINAVLDMAVKKYSEPEVGKSSLSDVGREPAGKAENIIVGSENPGEAEGDNDASDSVPDHPWIRQLFKRIAIHCHPDKVGPNDHKKMLLYMSARSALDNVDEASMIAAGLNFNELPKISVSEIKTIMKDSVTQLEQKTIGLQNSVTYTWGMSELDFEIKSKILVLAAKDLRQFILSEEQAAEVVKSFFQENEIVRRPPRREVGTRPEKLSDIRNRK